MCSAELEVICGIPRIPNNEASQEPEYKMECTSKPSRCLCFCHCCLLPLLCVHQPPHHRRDVRRQHRKLPALNDDGRVKVDVQNITFSKVIF